MNGLTRCCLAHVLAAICAAILPAGATGESRTPGHAAPSGVVAGDLVARRGEGLISSQFAAASPNDRRFSHLGVLIWSTGDWHVIHALADEQTGVGGVRRDPLRVFLAGNPPHAFFRVALTATQRTDFLAGLEAEVRQQRRFDTEFRLDDPERVYCTELVWRALCRATGTDPAPLKPRLFGRPVLTVESLTTGSPLVRELAGVSEESLFR